ncbi:MAG: hypothetical protein ABJA62_09945 [Luteimonas sp.]
MNPMKKTLAFAVALIVMPMAGTASDAVQPVATAAASDSQNLYAFDWNPRSGDAWVDQRLDDINHYGGRYRAPFIDEIVRYYDAPRDLVSDLIVNQHWAPGDVYYACAIGRVVGSPCRAVADAWSRDHGLGWGAVAQTLGVAPGSDAFHRLKQGFVATYRRWARPILLDDELQRDFPNRSSDDAKRPSKSKDRNAAPSAH